MMQVIFSKIELETSPFLIAIQFYSNIDEKRICKSPHSFQRGQHSEIYLLNRGDICLRMRQKDNA